MYEATNTFVTESAGSIASNFIHMLLSRCQDIGDLLFV